MSKQFDGRTPPLPIRALYALRAAVVNPSLFWELGKKFSDRNLTAEAHARRVNEYDKFSVSAEVAVAAVTLANHGEVVDALSERALETIRSELRDIASEKKIGDATWGGFGEVCYAICRLMKPLTVLETGVAFGWTTAHILAALENNQRGHLYSIDLPAFRPGSGKITGAFVPDRLKHRWTLQLGSQKALLPVMLRDVDKVDFFHYDSDKTYQGMKWAYRTVWEKMLAGGVLMSDDMDNDAFLEFSEETDQTLLVVARPRDQQRVGFVRRP